MHTFKVHMKWLIDPNIVLCSLHDLYNTKYIENWLQQRSNTLRRYICCQFHLNVCVLFAQLYAWDSMACAHIHIHQNHDRYNHMRKIIKLKTVCQTEINTHIQTQDKIVLFIGIFFFIITFSSCFFSFHFILYIFFELSVYTVNYLVIRRLKMPL